MGGEEVAGDEISEDESVVSASNADSCWGYSLFIADRILVTELPSLCELFLRLKGG
jgi:hypothetical protein